MKLSSVIITIICILLSNDAIVAQQRTSSRSDFLGCWYGREKQSEELQDVQWLVHREQNNKFNTKFLAVLSDGKTVEQSESGTWSLQESVYTAVTTKTSDRPIDAAEEYFRDDYLIEEISSTAMSYRHLQSGRVSHAAKVPCDLQLKLPDGVSKRERCQVRPEQFCEHFASLHKEIPPDQLLKLKETKRDDLVQYHMSLGLHVRNKYGLWQDNEFTKFFRSNGIDHPDMMSHVFLLGFIGYLKNEPVDMAAMSREMLEKWTPPPPPSDK